MSESGELAGSVSGGCVESDVVLAAQEVLAGGAPRLLTYGITDDMAIEVGLPCGGEIDVFVEQSVTFFDDLRAVAEGGGRAVVFTVVEGDDLGAKLLVREDGSTAGDGPPDLAALAPAALLRGPEPRDRARRRVGLRGRLRAAAAAARLRRDRHRRSALPRREAARLDDDRRRRPRAVRDARADPERRRAARRSGRTRRSPRCEPDFATAVVVLTHDDKFDVPMLIGALATDAFYVGALGSRRNQARRNELLREAGVAESDLDRIAGPCGLDIGAESPAETALSMLAEILAVRAGRSGGPLKDASQRIHARTGRRQK